MRLDAVVVGGGQAGLAMAWHLDYLQAYADAFDLPVRCNARVVELRRAEGGEREVRPAERYRARQVVVATGPFQVPSVPPAARRLDGSVTQAAADSG